MNDVKTTGRNVIRAVVGYWLPLFAWMGMIFYLSAQPDLPSPPEPWLDMLLKKGAHFGVYALLAFWWWRALSRGKKTLRTTLGLAFGLAVLYSISDEFHQSFVPGRSARFLDVVIDAVGAAVAMGVIWRWRSRVEGS